MATKPIYGDLFSGGNIASDLEVDDALYSLRPLAYKSPARVLEDLVRFESERTLLCVLSREPYLRDHISRSFPTSPATFLGSVHGFTLDLLALELATREGSSDYKIDGLSPLELKSLLHDGLKVLRAIHEHVPEPLSDRKGSRVSKNAGRNANTADKHFMSFGIWTQEDWTSPDGRETCITLVLKRLKTASEALLTWVSSRHSVYTEQMVQNLARTSRSDSIDTTSLYPDNLAGFGPWKIVVGKRAETTLRQLSKRDPVTFEMLWDRLRIMSHGYLSSSRGHAKPATGPSRYGIPVLQDKVTRDLRIIYHVDCFPWKNVFQLMQEKLTGLKIIDVCSLSQMDDRLKSALHGLFKSASEEYKKRCTPHLQIGPSDQQVYMPESYPDLPEQEMFAQNLLDIGTNNDENQFSVERYTPLSKTLLDSLISGTELTLPHLISPQERTIIEHQASCYVLGRSGTGKTTVMVFKMLLIAMSHPERRQLLVTQSPMLADKISIYFKQLYASLENEGREHLGKVDGLAGRMSKLPEKFSELKDTHFPIITTVSKVWSMIEADIANHPRSGRQLSYDIFLSEYWSHFPEGLKSQLDPVMVFAEFLGVIKGSEDSLQNENRVLSRAQYLALSSRAYPTFSTRREVIYDLFDLYIAQRRINGDRDAADRTHSVISSLYEWGLPAGVSIDYLFVDEVQDNLLIDTLVLRALCHNHNGLFWAGDTAQTIAMGSSFRFNDLKAFQFRYEINRHTKQRLLPAKTDAPPQMFHLAINYRSHAGIVNCARSVIELIERFWPESIDSLAPEHGKVSGAQPIFFGKSSGDLFGQLDSSILKNESGSIDLGAEQCIIVRDEKAKARVQSSSIGKIGLIMTVYEAKGQEFNDVILLDLFGDSEPDESRWRLILQALTPSDDSLGEVVAPEYNPTKHANICVELKLLYVAITRARESLWIVDSSDRGVPIEMYWSSKKLVRSWTGHDPLPTFARSSAATEWEARGDSLFNQGQYEHAKFCFERAKLQDRALQAEACQLRIMALRMPPSLARDNAFLKAASAFAKCARMSTGDQLLARYSDAAQCSQDASDFKGAIRLFVFAEQFARAVSLAADHKLYEKAVALIRRHEGEIEMQEKGLNERVIREAKIHYAEQQIWDRFADLIPSQAEQIAFLKQLSIPLCIKRLLSLKRRRDAGMLYIEVGQFPEGIGLLSKDPHDALAMHAACECLTAALWQCVSFGARDIRAQADSLKSILQLGKKLLEYDDTPAGFKRELALFRSIASGKTLTLAGYYEDFHSRQDPVVALLRLDIHFARKRHGTVKDTLRLLEDYIQNANHIRKSPDFLSLRNLRLFGIRPSTIYPGQFLVGKNTMTNESAQDKDNMSLERVQPTVKHHFELALARRIEGVLDCDMFTSRLRYIMSAISITTECGSDTCSAVHLVPAPSEPKEYLLGVGEQLQRALGVAMLREMDGNMMERQKWSLFPQLYRAVFPMFYTAASSFYIQERSFDEVQRRGRAVVSQWCSELGSETTSLLEFLDLSQTLRLGILGMELNGSKSLPIVKDIQEHEDDRQNALLALRGSEPQALRAGLCFARALTLEDSLHFVEISVLCDYMDILCTLVVSAHSYQRFNSLHQITLPRSWTRFCRYWDAEALASQEVSIPLLCTCLVKVFCFVMMMEDGRLRFNDTELEERTLLSDEADVFRIRACLWIAVVALNIDTSRDLIHSGLSEAYEQLEMGLTDICGDLPWSIYEKFATDTCTLVNVSRSIFSRIKCSLEDFVEVIDPSCLEDGVPKPVQHVTRVFCSDKDALDRLLRQRSTPRTPRSLPASSIKPILYSSPKGLDLLLRYREFVTRRTPVVFRKGRREQVRGSSIQDMSTQAAEVPSRVDVASEMTIGETAHAEVVEEEASEDPNLALADSAPEMNFEEARGIDKIVDAAELDLLARIFDKALRQRRRMAQPTQESERHLALMTLFRSRESEFAGRRRIVMLGPGLHMLRFVEVVKQAAKNHMAYKRRQLKTSEDYNAALAEDDNARTLNKLWISLEKQFKSASVGEGEDAMHQVVEKVGEAVKNGFPFSVSEEDMLDFEIGRKGILPIV